MSRGTTILSMLAALVLGVVVGRLTTGRLSARAGHAISRDVHAGRRVLPQVDSERIPVGRSPVLGSDGALVTIVEFGDFQCPYCARVEATLRQIRATYGDDVRVVWKNGPLPFHDRAMPAAEAAMEAYAQGGNAKFWRIHDLLYQNQQNLDDATLERLARELGLNVPRFRDAMQGHTHRAAIEADRDLARAISAHGTPNFFINGANVVGAQPFDRFKDAIDRVLARARTLRPRNRVYAQMVAEPVVIEHTNHGCMLGPRPQDPRAIYKVPVGRSPTLGPSDALVTVVIFGDFQCPFCGRVQETLRALRGQFAGDLRIVWKNQPLPFHDRAMPAAEAAMEAYAQGGDATFWAYHDLLFDHQGEPDGLDRARLEAYARQLGLDVTRFRAALDHRTHRATLAADEWLAQRLEASGTPHFFINGRRLVGAQPIEVLARLITETRARAEALIRTQPGTTRANVYARTIARGATRPVYLPYGSDDH